MQVKHVVEQDDGKVIFQGILEGKELAFVIEMGLEALISVGLMPFASTDKRPLHDIHEGPEDIQ